MSSIDDRLVKILGRAQASSYFRLKRVMQAARLRLASLHESLDRSQWSATAGNYADAKEAILQVQKDALELQVRAGEALEAMEKMSPGLPGEWS
jgi:hypothetical protein